PAIASFTFTPSLARDSKYWSGDWDEITITTASPDFRPSARNCRPKRSFSVPEGPWRMTLAPSGSPPPTMGSNPSTPVRTRTSHPLCVRRHRGPLGPGVCWLVSRPLRTTSEASATGEEDEHQEGRGEQCSEFRNLEEIRL